MRKLKKNPLENPCVGSSTLPFGTRNLYEIKFELENFLKLIGNWNLGFENSMRSMAAGIV
ncbi:hypothetical protein KJ761_03570 [Patescibacteria group bacterium]|nr:hypothetical protein [Patescibacteria group bacterium]